MSIFTHTDFMMQSPSNVMPSYFFVSNLLTNYTLGWFFIDAAIVSLLVCLIQRRLFSKFLFFDVTCLAVIICIITVNTYLGVTLDLKSPYFNAIKYDYQSLPFFSLLAGSLISKSISLFNYSKMKMPISKSIFRVAAVVGLVLVTAALFYNMRYEHLFSTLDFIIFRVEPTVNLGYSVFKSTPIGENSVLMGFQYLGFAISISGLVWVSRHKLDLLLKRLCKD